MIRPMVLTPLADVAALQGSLFAASVEIAPFSLEPETGAVLAKRGPKTLRIAADAPAPETPPILGIVALTGAAEAQAACDLLSEQGALAPGGLLCAAGSEEAERWIAARLAAYAAQALAHSARMAERLETLRAAHADLGDRFAALEAFAWTAWRRGGAPAHEQLGEIAPAVPGLEALAGECVLRQRLPFDPLGLTEIEIPIAPQSDRPAALEGGDFDLELWLTGENAIVASWSAEAEAIARDGGARLVLDEALRSRDGPLELVVRAGSPADLARLRLGPPGPAPELEACLDGLGPIGGMLAFRAWMGPPGLSRRASARPPRHARPPRSGWLHASEAARAGARLASPLRRKPDFAPVSFWREQDGVLTHPLEGELVIAALPHPFPGGARAAELLFEHRAAEGDPVELAATVAADDRAACRIFDAGHGLGAPFAGWARLAPGGEVKLHLTASDAQPMAGDLYVAARPAPGRGCAYAWAILTEVLYRPGRPAA